MDTVNLEHCKLNIAADKEELKKALAERIITMAQQAAASGGNFTIALSGGSTPAALYDLLAQPGYKERMPWKQVQMFWGDERCVPHDSPESNYRMVEEKLLCKIEIPRENVHPTVGQDENCRRSADLYEASIRNVFSSSEETRTPQFDLILLGLGPEGHTASIFPESPVLQEKQRLVMSVWVEKLKMHRVTFTFRLINNARHIFFLVEGDSKKDIVKQVIESGNEVLPAQFVKPQHGQLEWYLDRAAAAGLNCTTLPV